MSDPFDSWYGLAGGAVRPARPQLDAVLPELLVGEYPRVEDLPWLRDEHGVTAVVNLQDDADLASKRLRAPDLERRVRRTRTRPPPRPGRRRRSRSAGDHPARGRRSPARADRRGRSRLPALQRGLQPRPHGRHRLRARPSRPVARRRLRAGQAAALVRAVHERAARSLRRARLTARLPAGRQRGGGTVLRSQTPSACSLLAAQLSSMMRAGGGRSNGGRSRLMARKSPVTTS